MVKRCAPIPDTIGMDNRRRRANRLTTTTHLFTALLLIAVGAALFLPLPTARAEPRASAPPAKHGPMTASRTGSSVSESAPPDTTATTTVAPPTVPTPPAPPPTAPVPAASPATAPRVLTVAPVPGGYGCGPALAYLQAHAAPGFTFTCPGYAQGHQAMTCDNVPGVCPDAEVIAIATPCPAAYMNEASNSWVVLGRSDAPIDPYGSCP